MDDLWDAGSLQTTSGNRPILYGTVNGDTVNGSARFVNSRLNELVPNGVHYVMGGGTDVVTGTGGADVIDGGINDDVLRGGGGNDTYLYNAGDGNDTITDATGSIVVNGVDLGSLTFIQEEGKRIWHATLGVGQVVVQQISDDIIQISGSALGGAGNSIRVTDFDNHELNIHLPMAPVVSVPSGSSLTLKEGLSTAFTVVLSAPAYEGQVIRIAAAGQGNLLSIVTGDQYLSLAGPIDIVLAAGTTTISLGLASSADVDSDTTIPISATLLSSPQGGAGNSIALNVALTALVEDPGQTMLGDREIEDFDPVAEGVQAQLDERGNRITTSTEEAVQDQLIGTGGIDTIVGGDLGDILIGNGGNDSLYAGQLVDFWVAISTGASGGGTGPLNLSGANDNNLLYGGQGDDTLVGSVVGDVLTGGAGSDRLAGMEGNDFLSGDSIFTATASLDWEFDWSFLETTPGGSTILSIHGTGAYSNRSALGGGDDLLYGGGGRDVVIGEIGKDSLYGDDGGDWLLGGAGEDALYGGAGNDEISGDLGWIEYYNAALDAADFIDGGAGNDLIFANGGADIVFGGADNDEVYGDSDVDHAGDDYINGEGGDDRLFGGIGSDTIIGGDGNDELDGNVFGSASSNDDDFLDGGDDNDILNGGDRNDTLFGGEGVDVLNGDGDAVLSVNVGNDYLDGGIGNDTLRGDGGDDILVGGAGDDQLFGDSTSRAIEFQGKDILDGGDDNDILYGYGGDDILFGGDGNDTLYGGEGADSLFGGEGNDTLYGDIHDLILDGGGGTDIVYGSDGDDVVDLSSGGDTGNGGGGNDAYVLNFGMGNAAVNDVSGSNSLRIGQDLSLETMTMTQTAGQLQMDFGNGDTLSMSVSTLFQFGEIVDEGAGQTLSLNRLIAESYQPTTLGDPNTDPLYNAVFLGAGVSASAVNVYGHNRDLWLVYDGPVEDWVDVDNLVGRGALVSEGSTDGYGIYGDVLVIHNWFDSPQSAYLGVLRDTQGNSTSFSTTALTAMHFHDGESGDDVLTGSSTVDVMYGRDGNDVLEGQDGNDQLEGGAGDDQMFGGNGNDFVHDFGVGDDYLEGGAGDDDLAGGVGYNVLYGGAGNDTLNFVGRDAETVNEIVINQGDGSDLIDVDHLSDSDSIRFGLGINASYLIENFRFGDQVPYIELPYSVNAQDFLQIGGFGNEQGKSVLDLDTEFSFADGTTYTLGQLLLEASQPTVGDDSLLAHGSGMLDALGGNDTIYIPEGFTGEVRAGSGHDFVETTSYMQDHIIDGGSGNDWIEGSYGDDIIVGGDGNDTIDGVYGDDLISGGLGDDHYRRSLPGWPNTGNVTMSDTGGWDRMWLSTSLSEMTFSQQGMNLRITSTYSPATASLVIENWFASPANRIERIEFGFNQFYDAAQFQSLADGINAAPIVNRRLVDQGVAAGAALSYTFASTVFLDLTGALTYSATLADGSALPSWLSFDPLLRRFTGTPAAVNAGTMNVVVTANDGSLSVGDEFTLVVATTVTSGTTSNNFYSDTSNGDTYFGLVGNDTANGNNGNDQLYGNDGDDVLSGGGGDDTLAGGAGNDTLLGGIGINSYRIGLGDAADSHTMESSGTHRIQFAGGITTAGIRTSLSPGLNGSVTLNLYYNADDPTDVLQLKNVYAIVNGTLQLNSNQAAYTFEFRDGSQRTVSQLLDLAGGLPTAEDDVIRATSGAAVNAGDGNDVLLGRDLADDLRGDAGDDQLYGNAGVDTLQGGAGNDVLSGGAGGDSMTGGLGNDTYVVDEAGDTINEMASEGIDSVQASITHSLALNVENLLLTGTNAINGFGNSLANTITGNSGANTLDGGAGADQLSGGQGNDIYVVDEAGDAVTEASAQGTDTVQSGITYTLTDNVENLTLTGGNAINGTGNALDNVLTSSSGVNVLTGGGGNDTYVVGAGDSVVEQTGEGTDTVNSSVTTTLSQNVENLTLVAGSGMIAGTGNALDNILNGSLNTSANALTGGIGNDTYVIGSGDTAIEQSGEGTDTVQSTVTHTLGNHVENLTLTGSGTGINGTGNGLSNVLSGVGHTGANQLSGLGGDDTYMLGTGDTVVEASNGGIDTVQVSATHTLAAHVEVLFLGSGGNYNGTGTSIANLLRGNSVNNTLSGGGGNDVLEGMGGTDILSAGSSNTLLNGGAGTDTLTAAGGNDLLIGGLNNDALTTGTGADIIAFNKGDGADTVAVSTVKDNVVSIGGGAVYADLMFQKTGNNLILKVGTDQITFTNYYSVAANRSVSTLQVVIEGTSEYAPGGGNAIRDHKIERFNFDALVTAFDAARTANPSITTWALSNALAANAIGGSDTAAIGGELAYRYARFGNLTDVAFTDATAILGAATFGTGLQNLLAGPGSGLRLLSVAPAPSSERMQAGFVNAADVSDAVGDVEYAAGELIECYAPDTDGIEEVAMDNEVVCFASIDEIAMLAPVIPTWTWSHTILRQYLAGREGVLGDTTPMAESYQDVLPRSLVAAVGAHGRGEIGRRLHVAD
jgi:Ca2+-binding RTX toxin-like protein